MAQFAIGVIGLPTLITSLTEERNDTELVHGVLEVLVNALTGGGAGADGGADTAVVHDDYGEETEETTVKSAAPSRDEVNGLIGRDGGALLGTLGTLVNGGTGGDGACGAPTLAKYLLEYRS